MDFLWVLARLDQPFKHLLISAWSCAHLVHLVDVYQVERLVVIVDVNEVVDLSALFVLLRTPSQVGLLALKPFHFPLFKALLDGEALVHQVVFDDLGCDILMFLELTEVLHQH